MYHGSILIISSRVGFLSKKIVRNYKWDRLYKIFRFQNSWHYIFKGEFFEFPRASIYLEGNNVEDIDFVYADALVDTADGTLIYDGIVVDYELSKDGGLDYFCLKDCERRYLNKDPLNLDKKSQEKILNFDLNNDRYYNIPGHIILIPYSSVTNLNFAYYKIQYIDDNKYKVVLVGYIN